MQAARRPFASHAVQHFEVEASALRIHEGATEVQRLIIARAVLKAR
jgi:alkylation response protein AidB-like acyl-CoA dehydrogenase